MSGSTIAGALNVAKRRAGSGITQLNANGQTIRYAAAPFAGGALVQVFLSSAATDIYGNS